ncbi:MAG: hypothetical protein H6737_14120 [Alphaproteobacteria bacterium]|nr:hypothetical protein [Alphaproteobacteria bacterium]
MSIFVLAIAGVASAGVTNESPHRKTVDGIGNCVFSAKEMPFQKDDTFELATKFEGPSPVYARCYYPKTVGEYRGEGKLHSQLRGDARTGPEVNRRLQFAPPNWFYAHTVKAPTSDDTRDQTYLWITPSGQCDIRKVPRTGACIDLDAEVRQLAEQEKASLPFTTKVCLHIDFDVVNEKIPNPENILEMIDRKQFVTIAKGCFDYTVK